METTRVTTVFFIKAVDMETTRVTPALLNKSIKINRKNQTSTIKQEK